MLYCGRSGREGERREGERDGEREGGKRKKGDAMHYIIYWFVGIH